MLPHQTAWAMSLLTCVATSATSQESGYFFEVVEVTPDRRVEHEVDIQGPFDDARVERDLEGPVYLAGCGRQLGSCETAGGLAQLVSRGQASETRRVAPLLCAKRPPVTKNRSRSRVRVTWQGQRKNLQPDSRRKCQTIWAIFWSTRLSNRRDEIVRCDSLDEVPPRTSQDLKPVYLGIPAAHWHHDDHTPVKRPRHGFVAYLQTPGEDRARRRSVLDQFGLNGLTEKRPTMLCVPRQLVE